MIWGYHHFRKPPFGQDGRMSPDVSTEVFFCRAWSQPKGGFRIFHVMKKIGICIGFAILEHCKHQLLRCWPSGHPCFVHGFLRPTTLACLMWKIRINRQILGGFHTIFRHTSHIHNISETRQDGNSPPHQKKWLLLDKTHKNKKQKLVGGSATPLKNPPTPLWRWRRAYWGANSYTKCLITFVNIAVAISALAGGGGQTRFRTETSYWWCLRVFSTIFGCLSLRGYWNGILGHFGRLPAREKRTEMKKHCK